MNKSAIRFLGMGLFLAGAALQVQSMLGENENASTSTITQKKYNDAQEELQSVKQQLAQLQLDLENAQNEETTTVNSKVEQIENETQKTQKQSNTLTIESGMNTTEISNSLEEMGIIQNKQDLEDYLIAQDLASRLQIGEYELNSSMTIKQISEMITK